MMDRKNNCFNFIRLLAAFEVFVGHASEHLEIPLHPIVYEIWYSFRGVPVLFILSGFLIWNSLLKPQDFKTYCKKRIFRLCPELVGGVAINAVIILLIYQGSIKITEFCLFIAAQATIFQFWTPSCLRGYGVGVPNGSLWTIGVMVQSYIIIYILHTRIYKQKRRGHIFISIFLIGILFNIGTPIFERFLPAIIYKLFRQTFIPYIWLFILGIIMCEYFDSIIKVLMKNWGVLLLISMLISILHIEDTVGIYATVENCLLGLSIVGFGYALPQINIKYDISYGFYIYHMIVINILVNYGYKGSIIDLLIALIVSIVFAVASYCVIGKLGRNVRSRLAC